MDYSGHHTFVRKYHFEDTTYFFPSLVTVTDIEEAVKSPNPRRGLFKLADFAFTMEGYVVKNRYNGATAPFTVDVTLRDAVKAFFTGYIHIR